MIRVTFWDRLLVLTIVTSLAAAAPLIADESPSTLGLTPPTDTVVLFDGSNFDEWKPLLPLHLGHLLGHQRELESPLFGNFLEVIVMKGRDGSAVTRLVH